MKQLPGWTLCILLILSLAACSSLNREVLYPGTPSLLPGTNTDMNTPGFWISRHPAPDAVLLDATGISALNAQIREKKLVRDLADLPPKTGEELVKEFTETAAWIANVKIYQSSGKKVNDAFMEPLVANMNLESIPATLEPRYGFLIRQSNIRVLPTIEPLYDGPHDFFIDNLQASSLEWGTPLVITHQSRDGSWLYAVTEQLSGWLPSASITVCDHDTFLARYRNADPLIVINAKTDLFADEALTRYCGNARMGTRLIPAKALAAKTSPTANTSPTAKATATPGTNRAIPVFMPARDEAGNYAEQTIWVDARTVSQGFLPYTPRTIYEEAFRLLHTPYGWGGTFGEQDCSQFLCEIFSTVGITLPRNSSKQAQTGTPIAGFTTDASEEQKKELLAVEALPGATLLRLPGHIMLYLGTIDGEPYVIHSTWAYLEKRGHSEIRRLVNRVVVSTLRLGEGSSKGTHLFRLTTATMVLPLNQDHLPVLLP